MNKPHGGIEEFRAKRGSRGKEDWIADQLRKVYDEAATDEIPDDMMSLLNSLDDAEEDSAGQSERSDQSGSDPEQRS